MCIKSGVTSFKVETIPTSQIAEWKNLLIIQNWFFFITLHQHFNLFEFWVYMCIVSFLKFVGSNKLDFSESEACSCYSNQCLHLACEKFVLTSESNLSLATGLPSWKVSPEPWQCYSRLKTSKFNNYGKLMAEPFGYWVIPTCICML